MSTLILGIDSGLDGAFCWMRNSVVLHHVLTRTLVKDGAINMAYLSGEIDVAESQFLPWDAPRIAYLEEPFNNAISGGASTAGYTDQCKRWGRLQGWLESWGYEVRGVQAKTWQRELLDLARFEVRTEQPCKPRLAEGWKLKKNRSFANGGNFTLSAPGQDPFHFNSGGDRAYCMEWVARCRPEAIVTTKSALSHDTKAASLAYVRANFPDLNLIPPRARNPHDGLADAVCIAVWGSTQVKET